jgi:hypothetical protein
MDWIYEYYRLIGVLFFFSLGISLLVIAKWIGSNNPNPHKNKIAGGLGGLGIIIILFQGYVLLMQYLRESP